MRSLPLLALVLGLTAVACKGEPVEAGATGESAVPAAVPAPAPVPVVAAVPEWTMHIASFRDNRLDECVELALDLTQVAPEESARLREGTDQFVKGFGSQKGVEMLKLQRPCVEQFADRTVLATCLLRRPDDHLGMTTRFYDIRTLEQSDAPMKGCLSMGGDWQSSADEGAVTSERFHDHVRQFQDALSKMEAAQSR